MQKTPLIRAVRMFTFAVVTALLAGAAAAQVESGRFVGRIADPQDAVVTGATVKVAQCGHQHRADRRSPTAAGTSSSRPSRAGNYVLSVTAPGFQTITTSNIEVQVGQIVREDLKLQIGSSTTTVEVDTPRRCLHTDSATVGQVITNRQLTDLPLNGRGFFRLAELTPGAALLPPTGNSLAIRPEVVNGNVISGIRGSATSFLLDGVDVSEQHQGGTFIQTSIDALQEFSSPAEPVLGRVQPRRRLLQRDHQERYQHAFMAASSSSSATTSSMPATTSRSRGRSSSATSSAAISAARVTIPHLYNGTDRTFFFVDYEGQRLRQGLSSTASFASVTHSAPATSAPRPSTIPPRPSPSRQPTPATPTGSRYGRHHRTHSASQQHHSHASLSPQALAIQDYVPLPNTASGTFSSVPVAGDRLRPVHRPPRSQHQLSQPPLRALDLRHQSGDRSQRRARAQDRRRSPPSARTSRSASSPISAPTRSTRRASTTFPATCASTAFLQGPDYNAQFGVTGLSAAASPRQRRLLSRLLLQRLQPPSRAPPLTSGPSLRTARLSKARKTSPSSRAGSRSSSAPSSGTTSGSATTARPTPASSTSTAMPPATPTPTSFSAIPPPSPAPTPPPTSVASRSTSSSSSQDDIRLSDRLTINAGLRYEYSPWLNGYKGQIGTFDPTQSKPDHRRRHRDDVPDLSRSSPPPPPTSSSANTSRPAARPACP